MGDQQGTTPRPEEGTEQKLARLDRLERAAAALKRYTDEGDAIGEITEADLAAAMAFVEPLQWKMFTVAIHRVHKRCALLGMARRDFARLVLLTDTALKFAADGGEHAKEFQESAMGQWGRLVAEAGRIVDDPNRVQEKLTAVPAPATSDPVASLTDNERPDRKGDLVLTPDPVSLDILKTLEEVAPKLVAPGLVLSPEPAGTTLAAGEVQNAQS